MVCDNCKNFDDDNKICYFCDKTTQKCSGGNTIPQSVSNKSENRYRNFCFTLNNYNDADVKLLKDLSCKYIVIGFEVGKSGTPHLQGYVEFENAKTFSACKKCIGKKCHIENRRGTSIQASDYCKKDGKFYEDGELSSQGARADLIELKNEIMSGSMSVDDIALSDPIKFHQYGRTLNKIEDLKMRKLYRNFVTEGIWIYGPAGVGKTKIAMENFTPDTHYNYPYDNGWWDGYKQQNIVIINEFRGQITYSKLLDMVDRYPYNVKRRNREPLPFMSKKVVITCPFHPCKIPDWNLNEQWEQLYRRFKIYRIDEDNDIYLKDEFNNDEDLITNLTI